MSANEEGPGQGLRQVGLFFVLTLLLTSLLQMPAVFGQAGLLPGGAEPYMPLVIVGVFGPLLSAWFVTRRYEGKDSARLLFRSLFSRTPAPTWMFAALALPGALLTLALSARYLVTGLGPLAYPPEHAGRIVAAVLISVGEEVGWRGYALPRLSKSIGRIKASLVIGAVWTLWHVPMFLGAGVPLSLMPIMLVFFCGGSLVATWLYFRTQGSLLIAVLFHIGAHLNNSHLPLPADTGPLLLHTIAWVLAAALLMADRKIWRPRPAQQATV